MKANCIIIFGGGHLQLSLINTARKKGFFTVVLDPDKSAPGKNICDSFHVVGGQDYRSTLELARKYGVRGVATAATDKPLLMMARIAKARGLHFPSLEAIRNTTDKFMLKKVMQKGRIPCAKGRLVKSGDETFLGKLNYPVIVKPVDNSGSRGVVKVVSRSGLRPAIRNARRLSKSKKVLVEEYVAGPEYSVESITCDSRTTVVQITEKITSQAPYNVEMGHNQPAELSRQKEKEINIAVKKLVATLKLNDCACHTELKLTPTGPVIIENGARLGGDYITSHLTPLSTGIDMESLVIDIAVGRKPDLKKKFDRGAAIRFIDLPPGQVNKIGRWRSANELPGIICSSFTLRTNDRVPRITDSLSRYGYIIARGKDRKDAIDNVERGLNQMKKNVIIAQGSP